MHSALRPQVGERRLDLVRASVSLALSSLLIVLAAACGESSTGPARLPSLQVATVEFLGMRPALYIDSTGAAARTRIHFAGAEDPIPGNDPLVPRLTDDNLLALGPLAWSPDGRRLAFVATVAFDEGQVAVLDATTGATRIASINTQVIPTTLDWAPGGDRLLYGMSTRAHALGVELFTTDLATNRVQQLTDGVGVNPVQGAFRFDATGAGVFFSRVTGDGGAPAFEPVNEVVRLDPASGAITRIAGDVVGSVQAIAHSGTWALVIRHKGRLADGSWDESLVRVSLVGDAPRVLVDGGRLAYARLTNDDARVLLVSDDVPVAGEVIPRYYTLPSAGGTPESLRGTTDATVHAAGFFDR